MYGYTHVGGILMNVYSSTSTPSSGESGNHACEIKCVNNRDILAEFQGWTVEMRF